MRHRMVLALAPLLLGVGGCGYNQIQRYDENAQQAKQQMATANATLTGALGRLIAISEAYPQLKADQGFLRLQDELTGTENRIATSRNDYNQAVQSYNTYIRTFPQALTAKVTGAKARTYYEAAPGSETAPTVDFGTRSTGSSTPAAGAPR